MKTKTYEAARQLSETDIQYLRSIYEFRCLDLEQSAQYFYDQQYETVEDFQEKVDFLLELELIEVVDYKNGQAVFLTNRAIEIIRDTYGMATNIVDPDRNVIRRGYYTAGELKMLPRLINHQVHLNRFVLDFSHLAQDEQLNWKHYGEKFVSQYHGIRPDGMIRFYDIDIFLEQDMATESKTQLMNKWDNYRTYLRSKEHDNNTRKIIMLFIIDGTTQIEKRKDLVRYTATDSLIDLFSSRFEVYVGTREELLDLLFTSIIPTMQGLNGTHNHFMKLMRMRHGYTIQDATRLKQFLSDTEYNFMIYKMDEHSNLMIQNGRLQEFLVDDATDHPFSLHHKLAYHKRNSASFYRAMNRHINVIFLVDSERAIKNQLHLTGLMGTDNVYYTTLKRLEERSFSEALFQFDRAGKLYHFKNNGLIQRVYED